MEVAGKEEVKFQVGCKDKMVLKMNNFVILMFLWFNFRRGKKGGVVVLENQCKRGDRFPKKKDWDSLQI